MKKLILFIFLLIIFSMKSVQAAEISTANDIKAIKFSEADYRIKYGPNPMQFADLRLPESSAAGPFPVLVLIHGGCWSSKKFADLEFMSPFADSFREEGIATWNIEFRGVEDEGGGWPGSFKDVGMAIDHLKVIAEEYNLDLSNITVVGHSSGGYYALWSGIRQNLKKDNDAYVPDPLKVKKTINLAGPADLESFMKNTQEKACGDKVINKLLGDTKENIKRNLKQSSVMEHEPVGISQSIIIGRDDKAVDEKHYSKFMKVTKKRFFYDAGLTTIYDCGHFDLIHPKTEAFAMVHADIINGFKF